MEDDDAKELRRKFFQALHVMEEAERARRRTKLESQERSKRAVETPTLTAQAAADYYHDLTAAQDMLDGKA